MIASLQFAMRVLNTLRRRSIFPRSQKGHCDRTCVFRFSSSSPLSGHCGKWSCSFDRVDKLLWLGHREEITRCVVRSRSTYGPNEFNTRPQNIRFNVDLLQAAKRFRSRTGGYIARDATCFLCLGRKSMLFCTDNIVDASSEEKEVMYAGETACDFLWTFWFRGIYMRVGVVYVAPQTHLNASCTCSV